jgi:MFS family permease
VTTVLRPLGSLRQRSAFAFPAYRRLWLAAISIAFATWLERLSVGWLVLDRTGSPFLAALTFAARMAPNLVFGPLAGVVADRAHRAQLIAVTASVGALITAAIALVILADVEATWPILALVALVGVARIFQMPAEQALIVDIVGVERSTNAVALYSVGVRSVGVLGALSGGVLIERFGPAQAFLAGAACLLLAAFLMSRLRAEPRVRASRGASLWRDAIAGVLVLLQIPTVAALLVFALLVEMLAFSYGSLMPTVAMQVLEVGAPGLGALTAAAGVGSVVGSLTLSIIGGRVRRGMLLLSVTFAYGVLLVVFGASDRFVLSLLLVAGVGAAAAMFDALQWILLQLHVPDEMRGRALGGWVWAIGFGWLGPVVLGALAESIGVPRTLALSGSLVVVLALSTSMLVPGLRRA